MSKASVYKLETLREIFRGHLLVALDSAAVEAFDLAGLKCGAGALDADLPRLYRHLDRQIFALVKRYDVTLEL